MNLDFNVLHSKNIHYLGPLNRVASAVQIRKNSARVFNSESKNRFVTYPGGIPQIAPGGKILVPWSGESKIGVLLGIPKTINSTLRFAPQDKAVEDLILRVLKEKGLTLNDIPLTALLHLIPSTKGQSLTNYCYALKVPMAELNGLFQLLDANGGQTHITHELPNYAQLRTNQRCSVQFSHSSLTDPVTILNLYGSRNGTRHDLVISVPGNLNEVVSTQLTVLSEATQRQRASIPITSTARQSNQATLNRAVQEQGQNAQGLKHSLIFTDSKPVTLIVGTPSGSLHTGEAPIYQLSNKLTIPPIKFSFKSEGSMDLERLSLDAVQVIHITPQEITKRNFIDPLNLSFGSLYIKQERSNRALHIYFYPEKTGKNYTYTLIVEEVPFEDNLSIRRRQSNYQNGQLIVPINGRKTIVDWPDLKQETLQPNGNFFLNWRSEGDALSSTAQPKSGKIYLAYPNLSELCTFFGVDNEGSDNLALYHPLQNVFGTEIDHKKIISSYKPRLVHSDDISIVKAGLSIPDKDVDLIRSESPDSIITIIEQGGKTYSHFADRTGRRIKPENLADGIRIQTLDINTFVESIKNGDLQTNQICIPCLSLESANSLNLQVHNTQNDVTLRFYRDRNVNQQSTFPAEHEIIYIFNGDIDPSKQPIDRVTAQSLFPNRNSLKTLSHKDVVYIKDRQTLKFIPIFQVIDYSSISSSGQVSAQPTERPSRDYRIKLLTWSL
ncbi:MAG: hypothetical protein SFU25_08240 [Candidatus Caenarcaniphilales bacterium]|nr:hypothetical protein [Candidatus Caenarcaniphilales bacterium]